jgi:hypothetical protein
MVLFQKSNFTRELPKTKAELRQILAEAVRNTQPTPGHRSKPAPKAKKDRRQGAPPAPSRDKSLTRAPRVAVARGSSGLDRRRPHISRTVAFGSYGVKSAVLSVRR